MAKETIYLDIEPKWVDLAPYFIDLLEDNRADEQAKHMARNEIMKMAHICTKVRDMQKSGELDI